MQSYWSHYGPAAILSVLIAVVAAVFVGLVGQAALSLGPGAVAMLVSGCLAVGAGVALPFHWRRRHRRMQAVVSA